MIAGWQKEPLSTGHCTRCSCAWDRVLNVFLATSIFFGWLRQPAGRMVQVSSVAGAVYIYIRFQSRDQIELCQEHGA